MSTSNKRSLVFIIIFLLLTNIGVLGYFLWYKKLPNPSSDKHRYCISLAKTWFRQSTGCGIPHFKERTMGTIKPMFEEMRKADSLPPAQ
jgi:hypothetical protein